MWNSYLAMLVMVAFLRVDYELNRSSPAGAETEERAPRDVTAPTPRQREWAERAVSRYAAAQERKWRSWNEAMFERE